MQGLPAAEYYILERLVGCDTLVYPPKKNTAGLYSDRGRGVISFGRVPGRSGFRLHHQHHGAPAGMPAAPRHPDVGLHPVARLLGQQTPPGGREGLPSMTGRISSSSTWWNRRGDLARHRRDDGGQPLAVDPRSTVRHGSAALGTVPGRERSGSPRPRLRRNRLPVREDHKQEVLARSAPGAGDGSFSTGRAPPWAGARVLIPCRAPAGTNW